MAAIQLTESERAELQEIVRYTRDAKELRRAQALLELDSGGKAKAIAEHLGVGRSTVYDWANRFRKRQNEPVPERLRDRPRPGRPAHKRQKVKEVIPTLLESDPRTFGYRYPVWTTPLLQHHFEREHGLKVSRKTIRRALRELKYRYKRPRYVLARRSPHWRQAKGGSSEA